MDAEIIYVVLFLATAGPLAAALYFFYAALRIDLGWSMVAVRLLCFFGLVPAVAHQVSEGYMTMHTDTYLTHTFVGTETSRGLYQKTRRGYPQLGMAFSSFALVFPPRITSYAAAICRLADSPVSSHARSCSLL